MRRLSGQFFPRAASGWRPRWTMDVSLYISQLGIVAIDAYIILLVREIGKLIHLKVE